MQIITFIIQNRQDLLLPPRNSKSQQKNPLSIKILLEALTTHHKVTIQAILGFLPYRLILLLRQHHTMHKFDLLSLRTLLEFHVIYLLLLFSFVSRDQDLILHTELLDHDIVCYH